MSENSNPSAPGRPFPPGVSGNPKGRPKRIPALVGKCRRASQEVVDTWLAILRSGAEKAADRIKAGELLVAYGYGKPRQALEVSGPNGEPISGALDASVLRDPAVVAAVHAALLRKSRDDGSGAVASGGDATVDPGTAPDATG